MSQGISVVVVEDNVDFRHYLETILRKEPGFRFLSGFANAESAAGQIKKLAPELAIVDLELPKQSGIELIAGISQDSPQTVVVVLSAHTDDLRLFGALQAGASSYLTKENLRSGELVAALEEAHAGGSPMSPAIARRVLQFFQKLPAERRRLADLNFKQRRLLEMLAQGLYMKEIATELGITERMVRYHVATILKRLKVNSRAEALKIHFIAESLGSPPSKNNK